MFGQAFFSQGYFGGGYFGHGAAVAPSGGDTFLGSLRTYLLSRPELSSLTDVFLNAPGLQSLTNFPYLVVNPIQSPISTILQGGTAVEAYSVQLSVVSESDFLAESLGKAAYSALSPYSGVSLVWNDGHETFRGPTFRGQLLLQPGRWADDRNIWSYTFGYTFWITGSLL